MYMELGEINIGPGGATLRHLQWYSEAYELKLILVSCEAVRARYQSPY
jgi:hypothetical protein